ncbi:MAG: hypothetical protein ACK4N5_23445 [Myxococcales bacterium]
MKRFARTLLGLQGGYFLATGVWPLLHYRSFEQFTGRKRDAWLVKTVGLLIAVSGASMLLAARRGAPEPEAALLAAGQAGALGAVDAWYALRGVISPVYLGDAVVEAALVGAWLASRFDARRPS